MRRSQIKGSANCSSKPSIPQSGPAIGRHLLTPCRRLGLPLPKKRPKEGTSPVLTSGLPSRPKPSTTNDSETSDCNSNRTRGLPRTIDINNKSDEGSLGKKVSKTASSELTISLTKSAGDSVSSPNGHNVNDKLTRRKSSPRACSTNIKYNVIPSPQTSVAESNDSTSRVSKRKSPKPMKHTKSSENIETQNLYAENTDDNKIYSLEKINNGNTSSKTPNNESLGFDKTSNMSMISNFDEFIAEVVSSPTLSPIDLVVDEDSISASGETSQVSITSIIQPEVVLQDFKFNAVDSCSKYTSPLKNKRKNETDDQDNSYSDDDFDNQKTAKSKKIVISRIYSKKVSKSKENSMKDDKSLRKTKSAMISNDSDRKKLKKVSKSEKSSPTKLSNKSTLKLSQNSVSTLSDSDDDFTVASLQKKTSQIPNETTDLTQKIDEIKKRLEQKQKKLILLQSQNPKVNDCLKLEELILKWRMGCQEALNELLDFNKKKQGCEKINMEELLGLLHIPHDLVKYNQEKMDFD